MDNKQITLFDANSCKDTHSLASLKTDIQIFIEGTDELVFRGSNRVILPGASFTAKSHFDINTEEITPSYNDALDLDKSPSGATGSKNKCFLFAVGTDGSEVNSFEKIDPTYEKWISTKHLVPFRYPNKNSDTVDTTKYFGKDSGVGPSSNYNAYYFKAFEGNGPALYQKYKDDATLVTKLDVDTTTGYYRTAGKEIQTYIEINLKVTKEDCREFFKATKTINDARINTISLLTATEKTHNGNKYYDDIRPLTKLNFPNELLIDETKGLDIIYHIYY